MVEQSMTVKASYEQQGAGAQHATGGESESTHSIAINTLATQGSSNTTACSSRVVKKSNTKKRKKDRCNFNKCGCSALKFIGDCQFCEGHFCSKHRLMENHSCYGLRSCKEQMHQKNADKLAQEQTIAQKIQI